MADPKVSEVKKYLNGILKVNKKYVTCERLSKVLGHYPDDIAEFLSYFNVTLKMDPDFNLMEIVPDMKNYIISKEEEKVQPIKKPAIRKGELSEYESIIDFVYKKMTFGGGLVDKNAKLTDRDLRVLKKLIVEEQNKRKK